MFESEEYAAGYSKGYQDGIEDGYERCMDSIMFEDEITIQKLLDIYERGDMPELMERFRRTLAQDGAVHMLRNLSA